MSRIAPALCAWAGDASFNTGSAAVTAKNAAAATRITCQPPDLHLPTFGIPPVCLSVRRSLHAPYPSASGGSLRFPLPVIRPGQHTPFYPDLQAVAQRFNRSAIPSPVAILRPFAANPIAERTLPYFHPISSSG